ncbi:TonB-dependent receptor [Sandaracinobacteroides saxicola]|uniref:TonB-dependent receptor n=1 Tax=Sandaracinobacteroides saxicola TaxID=2759707 RepID=A0A7G5II87_9SPHN|nr:TonB-dependent receptor [Sandaracinobacteroides saxicola]QMW23079.1 TonB-dependent receptor [Sandaracinobacteroides saxicola]
MTGRNGTWVAVLLASVALPGLAVPAVAQTAAAPAAPAVEEIIVTGTKRDEKFIDVPVAVQVFSEKAITQAGITRPQDFLGLTPNVTFIQSNHAGEAFVNVRGQTSVRQSESAVAVVIDGVQLATQNEFNGELFDIQQIEVLKGPQGALYGRNAAAGAIIITTKPPTDELSGSASISYGNWQSVKAVVSAGGAIVPGKLRVRVSGAINDSEGPFTNIITGEKSYRTNEKTGRLRLDWNLTDDVKLDIRVGGSHLTGGAIAAQAQGPNIVVGGVRSPVNSNAPTAPYVSDVPGSNVQDKFSSSLKLDADLGLGTITAVSAYSRIVDNYQAKLFPYMTHADPRNDAGNAILFGDQTQKYRIANKAFSQEIRFTSKGDGPVRYQAGLYFLTSTRNFTTEQGYNGRVPLNPNGTPNIGVSGFLPNPNGLIRGSLDPAISTAIFGAAFNRWDRLLIGGGAIAPTLGIDGLDSSNPTNAYDISEYKARNFAPFANAQWDITPDIELGVAARYDIEKREVRTLTPNVINPFTGASFNDCVRILGVQPGACSKEKTFKQVQPKVTLTYKFPERNGSVYATWGRSFKSGGFNAIGTRERVVQATQVGITRAQAEALVFVRDDYDKEVADSYEVGFKSEFADRRVSLNGAGFITNVRNAQQFVFFPAGSVQAVSAIDKVEIKGFEFDATARVADTVTLFAGFGYIDPKIKAYRAQASSVGNRAPYVSDYNLTVGFQVNQPLSDSLTLNARGEYNRQGSLFFDSANTPGTKRDPVNLVNGRLGLSGERWEAAVWSRNLFNERYRSESVVLVTGIGVFNPGFPALPRSFGVEAKFKF